MPGGQPGACIPIPTLVWRHPCVTTVPQWPLLLVMAFPIPIPVCASCSPPSPLLVAGGSCCSQAGWVSQECHGAGGRILGGVGCAEGEWDQSWPLVSPWHLVGLGDSIRGTLGRVPGAFL